MSERQADTMRFKQDLDRHIEGRTSAYRDGDRIVSALDARNVQELTIIVPLVPPSVNHYVKHTRNGRHYVTKEAKAFKEAIGLFSRGMLFDPVPSKYEVEIHIYLGVRQKGDTDNFAKVCLDGLTEAGFIHSDAAVTDLILRKRRDRKNPRTEITVRAKA